MKLFLLIAFIFFGSSITFSFASIQSTAIRGLIKCGNERTGRVRLELWDKDRTDPDDEMTKHIYVSYGDTFTLDGKENEITTIDPELRIFHRCGDLNARCLKKSIIKISDEFVTKGEKPTKMFMAGEIDLLKLKSDETKECQ